VSLQHPRYQSASHQQAPGSWSALTHSRSSFSAASSTIASRAPSARSRSGEPSSPILVMKKQSFSSDPVSSVIARSPWSWGRWAPRLLVRDARGAVEDAQFPVALQVAFPRIGGRALHGAPEATQSFTWEVVAGVVIGEGARNLFLESSHRLLRRRPASSIR
jgi:hypothetical protein